MPDWDEILAQNGPAVWRTAYRISGNRADADECFQEAFLAAWKIASRGPVRHWRGLLTRLVAARAIDRFRRRLRREPRGSTEDWGTLPGFEPSPSAGVEDGELAMQLREALTKLPPKQAEAFCLQVLKEWTYAEIAEHMDESTDAVGVLLYRARKRLRSLLSEPLDILEPPTSGRKTKPQPGVEGLS